MNRLADQIRGVMFGQAVGDALGLAAEGLAKDTVQAFYPRGLNSYADIARDYHRRQWRPGEWTDDTEQMLHVLESLLSAGKVNTLDIARRLYRWLVDDGRGCGRTVAAVIKSPAFLINPHVAAREVWEENSLIGMLAGLMDNPSMARPAANGGVMRTAVMGVWDFRDPGAVRRNAETVCRVTHWDPRCVGSSVVVSLAINAALRGEEDRAVVFDGLLEVADEYDAEIRPWMMRAKAGDLAALELDSAEGTGFTLRTMAAGLWAWLHAADFRQGLLDVIYEGGDTDTNAAVAGAMMGARWGEAAIPEMWREELYARQYLGRMADELVAAVQRVEPTV